MLHELPRENYAQVRAIFAPLDYQLCTTASIDGTSPARFLVDDPAAPTAALLHGGEGQFLAGSPANPDFNRALHDHVMQDLLKIDRGEDGWEAFYGVCGPGGWYAQAGAIFPERTLIHNQRQHYVCTALAYTDWRDHLPDGFSVHRVTPALHALVSGSEMRGFNPYHWWRSGFHTPEAYFKHGVGHCVLHDGRWVAWCLPDCYTLDGRTEVGIYCDPAFRRRGLAACVVAAAVECAFGLGYAAVGWHCDTDNLGSSRTAEKVGFIKERDYQDLLIFASKAREAEVLGRA